MEELGFDLILLAATGQWSAIDQRSDPVPRRLFSFALSLDARPVGALLGLDVLEPSFRVTDGVELRADTAAVGGASSLVCHVFLPLIVWRGADMIEP
jgi:hypothetical protein